MTSAIVYSSSSSHLLQDLNPSQESEIYLKIAKIYLLYANHNKEEAHQLLSNLKRKHITLYECLLKSLKAELFPKCSEADSC